MSLAALQWSLYLPGLEPTTRVVLVLLADMSRPDGRCWPSLDLLGKVTGLTERSIRRHVQWLRDARLLDVEPRFTGDGRQTSNLYRLRLDAAAPGTTDGPPPETGKGYPDTGVRPGGHGTPVSTRPDVSVRGEADAHVRVQDPDTGVPPRTKERTKDRPAAVTDDRGAAPSAPWRGPGAPLTAVGIPALPDAAPNGQTLALIASIRDKHTWLAGTVEPDAEGGRD